MLKENNAKKEKIIIHYNLDTKDGGKEGNGGMACGKGVILSPGSDQAKEGNVAEGRNDGKGRMMDQIEGWGIMRAIVKNEEYVCKSNEERTEMK